MHSKTAAVYFACALCCCLLFLYSPAAVEAAGEGFRLWRDCILPALLPFFVCAYMMQRLGAPSRLERGALILLCLISGAPSGAHLMQGEEAPDTRGAAILNVISPMFIYGSFCCGMLGNPALAPPIILAQAAAAAALLLIFRPTLSGRPRDEQPPLALLARGLGQAMPAMLNICASIIFFMAVQAALMQAAALLPLPHLPGVGAAISGMLEMAGGSAALAGLGLAPRTTAGIAAFLFSFGGVCVFAQSLAFCPLHPGLYFSTKLLQGGLAGVLAYLITPLFPGAAAVFNPISGEAFVQNAMSFGLTAGISLLCMSAVLLMGAAARRHGR